MQGRKIIHVDADCFYAAVEMRDNPSLKHIPLAIGGCENNRGVLSTANYVAREYGIRSAMPVVLAKKLCPSLLVLPGKMEKYREASLQMHNIFRLFTHAIEPLSLDEAYLDVTNSVCFEGSATRIAEEIRARIYKEVGITVSAGVAPNKFIAKVASDWKKPDGLTVVPPQDLDCFVRNIPVKAISGVGRVAQAKLTELGAFCCADLQKVDFSILQKYFGSRAYRLSQLAKGIDDSEVCVKRERKSISIERTFVEDLHTVEECLDRLPNLLLGLRKRMLGKGIDDQLRKYYLKVKFNNFKQTTIEYPIDSQLSDSVFSVLLREAYGRQSRPVRLIGVGYRLSHVEPRQMPLLFEEPVYGVKSDEPASCTVSYP